MRLHTRAKDQINKEVFEMVVNLLYKLTQIYL